MVNEPLTAGRSDQSQISDRYSSLSTRKVQNKRRRLLSRSTRLTQETGELRHDTNPSQSPVPNFTVSNKGIGNHRNSVGAGIREGPSLYQSQTSLAKAKRYVYHNWPQSLAKQWTGVNCQSCYHIYNRLVGQRFLLILSLSNNKGDCIYNFLQLVKYLSPLVLHTMFCAFLLLPLSPTLSHSLIPLLFPFLSATDPHFAAASQSRR